MQSNLVKPGLWAGETGSQREELRMEKHSKQWLLWMELAGTSWCSHSAGGIPSPAGGILDHSRALKGSHLFLGHSLFSSLVTKHVTGMFFHHQLVKMVSPVNYLCSSIGLLPLCGLLVVYLSPSSCVRFTVELSMPGIIFLTFEDFVIFFCCFWFLRKTNYKTKSKLVCWVWKNQSKEGQKFWTRKAHTHTQNE